MALWLVMHAFVTDVQCHAMRLEELTIGTRRQFSQTSMGMHHHFANAS